VIKFKQDNIRTYTVTDTYKTTVKLFRTIEKILGEKFKFSISAGEYIGQVMEKEVDDRLQSVTDQ
jgi:hypothetical protein